MSSNNDLGPLPADPAASNSIWTRRLLISLTIIAWIAIACFVILLVWLVGESFILVLIGGLLAYIMYPFVLLLHRFMPQPLAIVLVYLILLTALNVLHKLGISNALYANFGDLIITQLHGLLSGALPFVGGVFTWIIFAITIA